MMNFAERKKKEAKFEAEIADLKKRVEELNVRLEVLEKFYAFLRPNTRGIWENYFDI